MSNTPYGVRKSNKLSYPQLLEPVNIRVRKREKEEKYDISVRYTSYNNQTIGKHFP